MQKAFIFDIDRCTGCQACQVACSIENQVAPEISWRQVTTFNPDHHPAAPSFHLSLACNHCLDAPCMKSCPASAYTKDPTSGAVTINAESCIGCKYCSWACPYDAPQFNKRAGVMEKCTFCNHRLAEGKAPSCVTACPTGALRFGDYDGAPGLSDAVGFPRVDVEPAIRFLNPRAHRHEPGPLIKRKAGHVAFQNTPSKVTLRSEWSLVVFTMLAATLAGWMIAGSRGVSINAAAFAVAAVVALFVSTLHLGKPLRAWRAILNWRTSWVSREIISFSSFLGVSGLYLATGQHSAVLGIAAVVTAAVAMFAMDRVYSVTATQGLEFHSARMLLVAPFWAGVMANEPMIYLSLGAVRAVFYVARRVRLATATAPGQWMWSGTRVLLGMALPLAWTMSPSGGAWVAIACVVAGEIIDRAQFYTELDIPTPRRQAVLDLAKAVSTTS